MWSLATSSSTSIRVSTSEGGQLDFTITASTNGAELFEKVIRTIGLRESWFFGLQYRNARGFNVWLEPEAKVVGQRLPKTPGKVVEMSLKVMFWPEDEENVIQETTLRLIYLEVRDAILSEDIYCPPEVAVLLASYILQVQFGDHQENLLMELPVDRLLPRRILEQHRLTADEWQQRIANWWADHQGLTAEEGMREFLKVAQDLDMFGVSYFPVTNKKGTSVWLGIDPHGLRVYELADKLTPKIGFPWHEMESAVYSKRCFTIKPTDRKAAPFVCTVSSTQIARTMLILANGNWKAYMRRRKPDSIEMQQMKAQAEVERKAKKGQMETLRHEVAARELAEKAAETAKYQLRLMEQTLAKRQTWIVQAQEKIRMLEAKLAQMQLEQQQREATLRQGEPVFDQEVVVREADSHPTLIRAFVESLKEKEDVVSSQNLSSNEDEVGMITDEELGEMNCHFTVSQSIDSNLQQSKEIRQLQPSEKKDLRQQQLKDLGNHLAENAHIDKMSSTDALYRANLIQGCDKYKTLRDIRKGNTMRRVEYFENM